MNEPDDKNDFPLDLALRTKQESIARNLVKNHIDLNKTDSQGMSLLHKAIIRGPSKEKKKNNSISNLNKISFETLGDDYSALFLVDNNISVNLQTYSEKKTALMNLAESVELSRKMCTIVKKILKSASSDINVQDHEGNTALHLAIQSKNMDVLKEILFNSSSKPNLSLKNKSEQTVLWLALVQSDKNGKFWFIYWNRVKNLNYKRELIFYLRRV